MSDLISRESVRAGRIPYDEDLTEYQRGWNDACDAIADNAPEAQRDHNASYSRSHENDPISRQTAMDFVGSMEMCNEISAEAYQKLMNYLEELPSAQPEHTNSWYINSWCIDCKEYDTENKCCPRYNRVIKQTLDDAYRHGETEAEARFHDEIVRCKDCKHQVKEWRTDKRLKDNGYMVCGCDVVGDACGYWALLGQDDDYCSMAERRTDGRSDK